LVALVVPVAESGPAFWVVAAAKTAALLAACSMASWLEERLYTHASAWSRPRRLAAALALPVLSALGGAVSSGVVSLPFKLLGLDGTLPMALLAGGAWLTLAASGSLAVVVLDVVVSAVVRDFRSRILLAVLGLVALSTTLATLSALFASQLRTLLVGMSVQSSADGAGLHFGDAPTASASGNLQFSLGHAASTAGRASVLEEADVGALVVLLACMAGLMALPLLLSACGKLADAVMERLHPLQRAFALVTAGDLSVHVEEGGSEDFVQLSRAFNGMVGALSLAQRMDRAYGTYLGKQVADRIRAQHGEAALPASSRVTSVLFADIRGFTAMSEKLPPARVLDILNRYFERVVAAIDAHEGYLNKFIGDAVVVVFNAPLDQADHAPRAVRCAIAIQQEVAKLNAEGAFTEVGGLQVGIGIATGPVVAGNLGSQKQMEYTVIGDTVNLAARLTSKAPAGEVWVNEGNAAALPDDLPKTALPAFQVKGKTQWVTASRVWPRPA
jgi:class 3 adenylate cyclase